MKLLLILTFFTVTAFGQNTDSTFKHNVATAGSRGITAIGLQLGGSVLAAITTATASSVNPSVSPGVPIMVMGIICSVVGIVVEISAWHTLKYAKMPYQKLYHFALKKGLFKKMT